MSNITKIRGAMFENGLGALLLTDETDRLYATGFSATYGFVLILPESAFFITDSRYFEAASEQISDAAVFVTTQERNAWTILRSLLEHNEVLQLGVQEDSLSYSGYIQLREQLKVEFLPAQSIVRSLRQSKEKYEVDCIVAAQRIAEKAFDHVLGFIKPGVSEKEIAAELEYHMTRNGAQGLAFETICVSGENSSRPHGVPGGRKVCRGDFITMDFGCRVNGYCSDMTRTIAIAGISPEMLRVYNTILDAMQAGAEAMRPGVEGRAADKAARDVIEQAGYGKFFGHGLGHSVGLDIHEGPNASPRETQPLPENAVITCEPGIYIPGRFGVRIEDMILIGKNGNVNLTSTPKKLLIL